MYIKRSIENAALRLSEAFPVILITGARQVGKTTLLKQLAKGSNRKYVTLDDPSALAIARTCPDLFIQRYSPPVIIDEIQYAPKLLTYIKIYVDAHPEEYGGFWMTGSQVFHLMKGVSESLVGRIGILNMSGLSNSEINGSGFGEFTTSPDVLAERLKTAGQMDLMTIYERIFRGSMPRLYTTKLSSEEYYYPYVQTYLQRDIRDLAQVGDEVAFYNFLCAAAARTGGLLNYDALAREADISAPTAKRWMSILVTSGVVILMEPYSNNVLKRVVKAPKLYFADTGLCSYLTKWVSPENLEAGAMSGAIFETWVVSEIYKSFLNAGKRPPLFYYRDSNKKEIDLIIQQGHTLYPVEIKKSAHPTNASKNFNALSPLENASAYEMQSLKITLGTGVVICMTNDLMPINNYNWLVPAWLI